MSPAKKAQHRPAEVTGGLAALATAITALAGGGVELVTIIGTAAGLLPAVVTYLVSHGGLLGVWHEILRGRA